MSSAGSRVPIGSEAPDRQHPGSKAGSARVVLPEPSLPAAATTTMPRFTATSAAKASGSTIGSWTLSVPNDKLNTRMLSPGSWACWTTQPMAAMTCETSVEPSNAPTLTLTTRASGATPTKVLGPAYQAGVPGVSRPAISDAMWVP